LGSEALKVNPGLKTVVKKMVLKKKFGVMLDMSFSQNLTSLLSPVTIMMTVLRLTSSLV